MLKGYSRLTIITIGRYKEMTEMTRLAKLCEGHMVSAETLPLTAPRGQRRFYTKHPQKCGHSAVGTCVYEKRPFICPLTQEEWDSLPTIPVDQLFQEIFEGKR